MFHPKPLHFRQVLSGAAWLRGSFLRSHFKLHWHPSVRGQAHATYHGLLLPFTVRLRVPWCLRGNKWLSNPAWEWSCICYSRCYFFPAGGLVSPLSAAAQFGWLPLYRVNSSYATWLFNAYLLNPSHVPAHGVHYSPLILFSSVVIYLFTLSAACLGCLYTAFYLWGKIGENKEAS